MSTAVRRLGRVALWVGLPVLVGALLLNPPWWEPPFSLPYWSLLALSEYPATAVSLGVLLAYSAWRVGRRAQVQRRWLPTYFLPSYVAGIESARALANSMAGHCFSAECMRHQLDNGAAATSCVLAATIVFGSVAACVCEGASWWRLRMHPVVFAIVLSVGLP